MSNIFVGQTSLRVQLTCSQDITGAKEREIRYRRPSGTIGAFTAVEGTAATGVIYYDTTAASVFDQAGYWIFWSYIKFSDDSIGYGDAVKQMIYDQGSGYS